MELYYINKIILQSIPSASGIEILHDFIYIMGDNSPYLFVLNKNYEIEEKITIHSEEGLLNGQIPKSEKPDFEAMTFIQTQKGMLLFIFGSGSKSPQRDVLVKINLKKNKKEKKYLISSFYDHLIKKAKLQRKELNIEAAAADDSYLYLFNRGRNIIFKIGIREFLNYLKDNDDLPNIQCIEYELPVVEGIRAGFSGACVSPEQRNILFTASLENTSNPIDDGEILGSFVGIIELEKINKELKPVCLPILEKNQVLKVKVESIALKSADSREGYEILLVTDSDGSVSELLEMRISL